MVKKLKETDLSEVKEIAKAFLWLDIDKTEFSPMIVKHPFTDSGIVALKKCGKVHMVNLLENEKSLNEWRNSISRIIEEEDNVFSIYLMIAKSYRIVFLKFVCPYLSQKDFSKILSDAWISSEDPNSNLNVSVRTLTAMFKSADKSVLMDDEEYYRYQHLDDIITVYRGVTSYNADKVRVLSWTLDKKTAEWFAIRFGEKGKVYTAQISRAHILAYFSSRNEQEVIVDPKYLLNITEV